LNITQTNNTEKYCINANFFATVVLKRETFVGTIGLYGSV